MSTSPTTRAATGTARSARPARPGVAGGPRGRAAARRLLPRRLHPAGADRRHRLSEQAGDLRPADEGERQDHPDHRRRRQASRRPHRHHLGAPYLGLGDDPSPACAHDRAGRRAVGGRIGMDRVPGELLPAGARALAAVPAPVSRRARQAPSTMAAWPSSAITPPSPTEPPSTPSSTPCASPSGSSTPRSRSPGPRRCSPISAATPTVSRSPTAA